MKTLIVVESPTKAKTLQGRAYPQPGANDVAAGRGFTGVQERPRVAR